MTSVLSRLGRERSWLRGSAGFTAGGARSHPQASLGPLPRRGGYSIAQEGLSTYTAGGALRLGPVHIEGSGGMFSGERDLGVWDGYYGSIGLQIKGGGL